MSFGNTTVGMTIVAALVVAVVMMLLLVALFSSWVVVVVVCGMVVVWLLLARPSIAGPGFDMVLHWTIKSVFITWLFFVLLDHGWTHGFGYTDDGHGHTEIWVTENERLQQRRRYRQWAGEDSES